MKLYDILVRSAKAALLLQDPELGCMPPGHNGSYHDLETPVRNTAHWLITFLKAYDISGEKQFLAASYAAANYLTSRAVRPMNATFWHRKNPHKDTCNGLIGQAWTIEALAIAAKPLQMPQLIDIATDVFLCHPCQRSSGLWRRVGVDGTYLTVDPTFNHQLWFAASGGLIAKQSSTNEVDTRVCQFLNALDQHLRIYSSGLIKHLLPLQVSSTRSRVASVVKKTLNASYLKSLTKDNRPSIEKAIGYHSFNLYAFALLKRVYPDHPFWQNKTLIAALEYARSKPYFQAVQTSKYGYPYNPPGFENPFVLETFYPHEETTADQAQWVAEQLSQCYDGKMNLMTKRTDDPATHAARLYEATRLRDLPIEAQF